MQAIDILFEIQRLFSAEDAVILLSALRQDSLIWFTLQQKEFSKTVAEKVGGELAGWSPANLAMLSLESKVLARDLAAEPMIGAEATMLDIAFHICDEMLKTAKVPGTLQEAGMVALALRERRRQSKSWQGLVQETVLHNGTGGETAFTAWRTPLACLYGLIPDADEMLADLLGEKAKDIGLRLATSILLAQPIHMTERAQRMSPLIKGIPDARQQAWLRLLKQQGQDELAASLAQTLMADHPAGLMESKLVFTDADFGKAFPRIMELQRLAELQYLSGQAQQAYTTLMAVKESIRGWEASVDLKMVEVAAKSPDLDVVLPDFEQLEKYIPDARQAQAEILLCLGDSGAKTVLDDRTLANSHHPLVQIKRAEALNQEGKRQLAQQVAGEAVAQIIHDVASQQGVRVPKFKLDWEPTPLLRGLIDLGLKQEALQLGLLLLQIRPVDVSLINVVGELLEKLGNLQGAIHYAHTAALLEPKNLQWHRWMARLWELKGDSARALREWSAVIELGKQVSADDAVAYMRCALKTNQPQKAIELGTTVLESDPNNGQLNAMMGRALAQTGELEEAIPYLSRATLLIPEEPESWLLLAEIYRRMGEPQKRLETLRSAVQSLPEAPSIVVALADACLALNSLSEALPFLKKAAELLPDSLEIAIKLGSTLQAMGFLREALQVFEQAREHWGDDPKLAFAYAETLVQSGEQKKALPVLEGTIQSNSPEFDWYLLYAQLLVGDQSPLLDAGVSIEANSLDNVREALEKALKIVPDNFQAQLYLAETLAVKGHYEQAYELYCKLVETNEAAMPEWLWRVQGGLGRVAVELHQTETALAALKEATQAKPGDLSLKRYLAETFLSAGLRDDAIQVARHVLRMEPDDLSSLIWFTNVALLADQKMEAKEAMQSAVQLSPDNANYRIQLAEVQIRAGDNEAARQTLHTLVHLIDLSIKQLRQVANLFVMLDDSESALACLQQALDASQGDDSGILFEMAGLLAQMGNPEAALQTIEQAIKNFPENIFQHVFKADLLARLERPRAAIECLEQVLQRIALSDGSVDAKWAGKLAENALPSVVADSMRSPTAVYLRLAILQRQLGNLTAALEYAGKALSNDPADLVLRALTVDLHQAMLQDEQALELTEYIAANPLMPTDDPRSLPAASQEAWVALHSLRVEDALNTGSEVRASQIFNEKLAELTDRPRVMVNQARLLLRQGDWKLATDLFAQAYADISQAMAQEPSQPAAFDVTEPVVSDLHLWLVPALLEMQNWMEAIKLSQEAMQKAPMEARPYLEFIRALAMSAERQRLCDELKCKVNVPGVSVLSTESYAEFETAVRKARQISEAAIVTRWQARGMAIFRPSPQNVRTLVNHSQEAGDTAAMMAALRRINNPTAAIQLAQRASKAPDVMLQLAFCQQDAEPEKSIQMARRAVESCSTDPIYQAGLALVAEKAGKYALACEALESALAVWPDEFEWHNWAAQVAERAEMGKAALQHRKKAVELQPENVDYALALAHNYCQLGINDKAIEILQQVGQRFEERGEIWAELAEAYLQSGAFENAFESAERARQLNAATPELFLHCGEAAWQAGKGAEALEYGQKALNASPDHAGAVLFISRILKASGKAREALTGINAYFNSGYTSMPLRIEQARLVKELEGAKSAAPYFEELVQVHPEEVELQAELAYVLAEADDIKGAENTAYIALQQQPDHAGLNLLMGKLKRSERQLDQALHYFSEAIRNNPAQVEAYLELAKTYQERREDVQALRIYQQAIKMAPSDPRPYYQAAMILREIKDYAGAETMLRRAAQIAPDDLNIRRQLGAIIALNLVHNSQEVNIHL